MRSPEEQSLALECLKLAVSEGPAHRDTLTAAVCYFEFVLGTDTDDAKAKLAAVRKAVA